MQEKAGLYQVEAADELSMILHVINTAEESGCSLLWTAREEPSTTKPICGSSKNMLWIENESLLSSQTARCSRTSAGN